MRWRDCTGRKIQIGDTVEDMYNRTIGTIVYDKEPMLMVRKQFSRKFQQYVECPTPITRYFIPKHSKLYWFLHGYRLDHIELLGGML